MPNVAVPTWPPGAPPLLPTPQSLVPWLVAIPLLALLGLLLARWRRPLGASLLAGAGVVGGALVLLARLSPGRTLVSPSFAWLSSGGLIVRSTFVVDPLRAVLLLVVLLGGAFAAWSARTREARISSALITLGGVLSASAEDWLIAVLGFGIGGLGSLLSDRPGSAGRVIASQVSTLVLVAAGALLFWAQGASGFGENGVPYSDTKLARLWGADAVGELVARPGTSVPVGVEESLALGDRAATGATWLPSDPSLSWRVLRDLIASETTGMRAHLTASTVDALSICLLFLGLVAIAIVWRARSGVLAAIGAVSLLIPAAPLLVVVPRAAPVLGLGGVLVALVASWLVARREGVDGTRSLAVVHAGLAIAAFGIGGPVSAALHVIALGTAVLPQAIGSNDNRVSRFVNLIACGPLPAIALLARAETAGRAFAGGHVLIGVLCLVTILSVGRGARRTSTEATLPVRLLAASSLLFGLLALPCGGRSLLATIVAGATALPDRIAPPAAPWWIFGAAIALSFLGYFLPIRTIRVDTLVGGGVGVFAGLVRFAANLAAGLEALLLEQPARRVTTALRRLLRRRPAGG